MTAPEGPTLESALECWPALAARFAGGSLALFLDYDGTLTPIVDRPELATLPAATRALLARLATRYPVAILSGRARADVAALVGLDNLLYAGSHGFDISGPPLAPGKPPLRHEVGADIPAEVDAAARELEAALGAIEGVLVEPKRFALAVHYRLAPEGVVPTIEAQVDEAADRFPGLRKTHGKKVFELRPAIAWDKGAALRWILDQLPHSPAPWRPLYIGDDTTDEDGFAAAAHAGGIGILVAPTPQPTRAQFVLRDPAEVVRLLQRIATLPD